MLVGSLALASVAMATELLGTVRKVDDKDKSFTMLCSKGTVTVEAADASVRDHGKFAKWDVVKKGAKVRVTGTLKGTKMKATMVNVDPAIDSGDKKDDTSHKDDKSHKSKKDDESSTKKKSTSKKDDDSSTKKKKKSSKKDEEPSTKKKAA